MAYNIIRSNGQTLTTIQDGTINTTSTSLSLPGRNSSQYGQAFDTNFVKLLENFASDNVPGNPVQGQLWFNTGTSTLNVCPRDGESNSLAWITLTSTNAGGTSTLGNLNVTGNANITSNLTVINNTTSGNITAGNITVTAKITAANANVTTSTIGTLTTSSISAGALSTSAGTINGLWTFTGNTGGGTTISIGKGNLRVNDTIFSNNYYWGNGDVFNPSGTYNSANVSNFLTGSAGVTQFVGNIAPAKVTTSHLYALNGTGDITGTWTLASNSSIQATYADLAERFEADSFYDEGTVVELGGDKEVTAVVEELSDRVFGVVSKKAAYIMNSRAGYTDETHPPIALSGRVPVKVIGQVHKGDWLVSAGQGKARSANSDEKNAFNTIGRALTNKTTLGEGTITAFVSVK